MGKKFACRTCRKEVTLDENGVANHLYGSRSPACIINAEFDRHEVVEDESTLVTSSEKEMESNQEKKEGD